MTITWYGMIVLVHVLAAIIGLGSTFASPFILKAAKNVTSAKNAQQVNSQVEKLAKTGSIILLLTGLLLGFLNTSLFKEFWYIASIALYIGLQPVVAYLVPKLTKEQWALLDSAEDEDLPLAYYALAKKVSLYTTIAMAVLVVMVTLMSVKPF